MTPDTQVAPVAPKKILPEPKSRFLIGYAPEMMRDPLGFGLDLAFTHGKIVAVKVGWMHGIFLSDPEYIRHVLFEKHKNYIKTPSLDRIRPMFGQGLLTSEGDVWKRQRRLQAPAFHRKRLETFVATMVDCASTLANQWQTNVSSGTPVDIALAMRDVTMSIVSRTLLGFDVSEKTTAVSEALVFLMEEAYRRLIAPFVVSDYIPTPRGIKFKQQNALINRIVLDIIRERREHPHDRGDLLSMMMMARDEETGEQMSDAMLLDEVKTMFLAGHETSANELAFAWYLLSKNPAVERRMADEIDTVLEGRLPTADDLAKLTYTGMVLQEVMRLYPTAPSFPRDAVADDEIDGYPIPARSIIVISPYVMHRMPEFWENPEGFDPDRFLPEKTAGRSPFAYLPFGAGPRACIGNNFAMMEMKVILAVLTQRYRLDLVPGQPFGLTSAFTLHPKYPILITLSRR